MTELYKLLGIKKLNTSAYHLQTDGLTEKFNQTLAKILSKYINFSQNDWDFYLPYALFAYRTSVHASTHMTPFLMLYGREARLPTFIFKSLPKDLLPEGYHGTLITKCICGFILLIMLGNGSVISIDL